MVWFGSRGPGRINAMPPAGPSPHYPPLNRLPHSESPPFSFKSIHHLPSFTKAPNMCICFAEVFVGGIRGASATVSLSLLPRLACPHRRRPTRCGAIRRARSGAGVPNLATPGHLEKTDEWRRRRRRRDYESVQAWGPNNLPSSGLPILSVTSLQEPKRD